jgi:Fe-S cluster biosynthesis and repair protein YggX
MVVNACNSCTQEAETEGLKVPRHPGIFNTLSKKNYKQISKHANKQKRESEKKDLKESKPNPQSY